MVLVAGMAVFSMGRQRSPLSMRLGAAIPLVGVVVWSARGGTGLHGGGWRRRATSVWWFSAFGSWQWLVVGHGSPGWCVAAE
jgi:hypothetical protein